MAAKAKVITNQENKLILAERLENQERIAIGIHTEVQNLIDELRQIKDERDSTQKMLRDLDRQVIETRNRYENALDRHSTAIAGCNRIKSDLMSLGE